MHVLIIGCGASGAAAAGHRVTVLDKNRKPLKKVGVTGNGRCNLMNRGPLILYGDPAFTREVSSRMGQDRIADFLTGLGIPLVADEDSRVYPSSFMASVVVDAFRARMKELNVEILQNMEVTSIRPEKNGFSIEFIKELVVFKACARAAACRYDYAADMLSVFHFTTLYISCACSLRTDS